VLEKYKNYLDGKLQKKLLEDGTTVYSDEKDVNLIKIYAPLSELQIEYLDAQYALASIINHRNEQHFNEIFKNFLREANGLDILFSALTIDGLQKIDRTNFGLNTPYNMITENNDLRPRKIPNDYLGIGGYSFNHSIAFIDKEGKVFVYDGDGSELLLKSGKRFYKKYLELDVRLLKTSESIESFLIEETERLLGLYAKKPWSREIENLVYAETVPNYVNK